MRTPVIDESEDVTPLADHRSKARSNHPLHQGGKARSSSDALIYAFFLAYTILGATLVVFEERLARTGGGPVLTHHLLGRFDAKTAWRFLAVHAEHHRRQLVGESAQPPH
jgi:hypothetical protein